MKWFSVVFDLVKMSNAKGGSLTASKSGLQPNDTSGILL